MKRLLSFIYIFTIVGAFFQQANAQAILQLEPSVQCGTYTYCVDIELKATAGNSFQLGTSSILLNYDKDILSFSNYIAADFDSTSTCTGTWSPQQFDVDEETGEFNLTMKLLNASSSCITIDTATRIVGTICFTINQQGGNPDITFNQNQTNLNKNTPDNGTNAPTITSWDSLTTAGVLVCDCPGVGVACNDNNVFTSNDQYDINCDCHGETLDADNDGIADEVDPCQDIIYEAENAYYIGGNIATNHMQYFGSGFVDWNGWQGDTLEFTIQANYDGVHELSLRYSNGSWYDRHLQLEIDGAMVNSNLLFPTTDTTWEAWDTVNLSHYFTIGTHTILFTSNPNNEPNMDRITLSYCNGCATTGQWCDDGDSCTILDITDINCNCAGVSTDSDGDGVCDQADICDNGDDNIDTDSDGIPDDCDDCNNILIGTSCNDGNPCTINDVYDASCNCAGTVTGADSDNDGVCDAFDICSGYDDNLDIDSDGIPDGCDTCNDLTFGMPCDDGNPCTVLDVIGFNCNCAGVLYPIDIIGVVDDISCYGFDNGEINLSIAGGLGDLIYDWSNGDSTSQIANLPPDNYQVIITDFRNCTDSASFQVNQPDTVIVNHSIVAASDTNGSIDLTVTGGFQPYTFVWETGDSTEDLQNLIPYTYDVIVTDSNNCVSNVAVDVYPADMCVDTILQAEDGILYGMGKDTWNERWALGDGFIYLTDDTSQYAKYYFDVPQDGFYTIGFRYTDKWATRTATILVDNAVEFNAFPFPRTYDWGNWQKAEFVDYLTAGTHELKIQHGIHNWGPWIDFISVCDQVVVPITLEATITNNICYDSLGGVISLIPTGGTRNYTYLWNTGDTSQTISGLHAGDYYVTITDEVGQTTIDTFTVGQPNEIIPTFTVRDVKCNGETNGRAWVSMSGGTSGYSYNWSNGPTWTSTYNVVAGVYDLTVTDANGCIKVDHITINEPDVIEASFDNTPSSGSDGTIDMTASGGNGLYTYWWKDSLSTEDRSGLAVGYYRVTITDTLGCKLQTGTSVYPADICLDTVMQAEDGIYTNMGYHIWYPDSTTGRGYIYFSGDSAGISTYTFNAPQDGYYAIGFRYADKWADRKVTVMIDSVIENLDFIFPRTYDWKAYEFIDFTKYLTAGTHDLQLKFRQSWGPRIDFITVCDLAMEGDLTHTDISCHGGSTGSATVSVTGGVKPYTILWNTGDTTPSISNLSAGFYSVTVTDTLNQTYIDTVDIGQATSIVSIITGTDVDCNGNANGQASVSVSGGVPGYSYTWNTGDTSTQLTNLNIGTYSLIVSDAFGCLDSANVTINEPTVLSASLVSTTNVDCHGTATGSATISATGGSSNYQYLWNNGDTLATANTLTAGNYTVTITDGNGCTTSLNTSITEPTSVIASFSSLQDINCNGQMTGAIATSAAGGTGNLTYLWNTNDTTANLTNLSGGNYTLTVTDANGCSSTISTIINEPTALVAQFANITNIDCYGNGNGSLDINATGGTGNYTYQWNNNSSSDTINHLQAGSYTVTITDANGCTTTDSATITEPTLLTMTSSFSTTTGADGTIDISPSGGIPTYSYLWSDGATTEDRTALMVGTYEITVTDANGCTIDEFFSIYDATTCIDDVYQAEENTTTGSFVFFANNGALGDGYSDFDIDTTETLSFTVQPTIDTIYEISIRYAQGDLDKALKVTIDGQVEYPSLVFSKTIDWTTWQYLTFKKTLSAGSHTIDLQNIESNGPDIDYLSLCMTSPDTISSNRNITLEGYQPTLHPYPNPATLDVNIDIELFKIQGGVLTIFDVNGRVMYQSIIINNGQPLLKERVSVEKFGEGVYFVQLKTAFGNIVKKITVIKQ